MGSTRIDDSRMATDAIRRRSVRRFAAGSAWMLCAFSSLGARSQRAPAQAQATQDMQEHRPATEPQGGLDAAQVRAIVRVVDESTWAGRSDSTRGGCSGAFLTPAWVATAWHCLRIRVPAV